MQALPPQPKSLLVAAHAPAGWARPLPAALAAPPTIVALRFSSLNVQPGTEWDGNIVTSTNTASVEIGTNLFDFSAPRTRPGRFHFHFHLVDVPELFVRPYVLHVTARNTAGLARTIDVPFRFSARATATAFNADARSTDALGAPPLVDMNGAGVDFERGVTVFGFIYTRCPDPTMCPLVTTKFARMAKLLAGTPVRLLEVTLDPAYDTPAVLRAYGRAAGADGVRWTLATGEPAAIAAFAERSGLYVDRPHPGLILHTEAVLIADNGKLENTFVGNDWTAAEVAAEARSVASLPANPLARFALRLFAGVVRTCGAALANGFSPLDLLLTFLGAGIAATGLIYALRRRRGARRSIRTEVS